MDETITCIGATYRVFLSPGLLLNKLRKESSSSFGHIFWKNVRICFAINRKTFDRNMVLGCKVHILWVSSIPSLPSSWRLDTLVAKKTSSLAGTKMVPGTFEPFASCWFPLVASSSMHPYRTRIDIWDLNKIKLYSCETILSLMSESALQLLKGLMRTQFSRCWWLGLFWGILKQIGFCNGNLNQLQFVLLLSFSNRPRLERINLTEGKQTSHAFLFRELRSSNSFWCCFTCSSLHKQRLLTQRSFSAVKRTSRHNSFLSSL